jgi:lysophospholipase L1-like esterase
MQNQELDLSLRKQFVFVVFLFVGVFALLEVGSRVVYFAFTGHAYALTYGLPASLNRYAKHYDGYFKYVPHKTLHQMDHDPPIPVTINSLGFRGADFEREKRDGVFRILTAGGSSTYGYHSHDDHTYPAILQRLLDADAPGRYEVVNVGLPMYTSDNIAAMLEGEGFDYAPDLLTLYTGYNDTSEMRRLRKEPPWIGAPKWVYRKSFFLHLAGKPLVNAYSHWLGAEVKEEVAAQFRLDRAKLDGLRESTARVYRANLERIVSLARERGVALVFIRQPMTTRFFSQTRIRESLPYAEEVAAIRRGLEEEGSIWRDEASILLHVNLMEILDEVAVEHGIPVVDGRVHTDVHPEHLVSWVHLSEEGNESLARQLRDAIVAQRAAGG